MISCLSQYFLFLMPSVILLGIFLSLFSSNKLPGIQKLILCAVAVVLIIIALMIAGNLTSSVWHGFIYNAYTNFCILILQIWIFLFSLSFLEPSSSTSRLSTPLLLLISSLGISLLIITTDFLILTLSTELSVWPIVLILKKEKSRSPSHNFFPFGVQCTGSLFIWIAVLIIILQAKTSSIAMVLQLLPLESRLFSWITGSAFLLLLLGLLIKTGFFPFHVWVIQAFKNKTFHETLFFQFLLSLVWLFPLGRFLDLAPSTFKDDWMSLSYYPVIFLMLLSHIMIFGAKKLHDSIFLFFSAYQTYIFSGFVFTAHYYQKQAYLGGIETAFVALIAYGLSCAGILSIVPKSTEKTASLKCDAEAYSEPGIIRSHGFIFLVFFLSLAGIPVSIGFFSRFFSISTGLFDEAPLYVVSVLISSVLLTVKAIHLSNLFGKSVVSGQPVSNRQIFMATVIIFTIIYLGIFPGFLTVYIHDAIKFTW